MKWSFIIAIAVLGPVLTHAVLHKPRTRPILQPANDRISHGFNKGHKKRGLFSPVPTFSQGIDYPRVKHSILKPFVVDYPVKSVPLGVKIPFRAPNQNIRHQVPHTGYGVNMPSDQKPTHLHPEVVKPTWPTHCPINPVVPVIPTSTTILHPAVVPAPSLTPILPLPHPQIPFVTKPVFKPILPQPVPVLPIPNLIRPGHSLHTSYFATFPRHPLIPTSPIHPIPHPIHPIPIHPAPLPIHPAPLPLHPAPLPVHSIHPAPLPLFHQPLNIIHRPLHLPPIPIHPHKLPIHPFPHPQLNIVRPQLQPFPINIGQFPSVAQLPLGPGPNVQFLNQEQANDNIQHNLVSNAWTPMNQFPSQSQLVQETEAPQYQHSEASAQQNEGYHYQQNPGDRFEEVNQQFQEQQYNNDHYNGNLQHEPQLPQALPNHPLSGRPINEAYQDHIPLNQHLPLTNPSENFANYS